MTGREPRRDRAASAPAVAAMVVSAVAATAAGPLGGCGDYQDASPDVDASPARCRMESAFAPAQPVAGAAVTVTGSIDTEGATGFETYEWDVRLGGVRIDTSPADDDSRQIQFVADRPGAYQVTLFGSVGGLDCVPDDTTVNVHDPDAASAVYRVRAAPGPDLSAPPQHELVAVVGGVDAVRDIALDAGLPVTATVTAGGAPVAAYVRLTPAGDPAPVAVEAFTGPAGQLAAALLPRLYDAVVVPDDPQIAPVRVPAWSPQDPLAVPPGAALTGTVRDPAGAPVVGARVTVRAGGVPSTVGVTDAGGAFAVARTGGSIGAPVAVYVSPPAGAGLPALVLDADAGVVATATLDVRYASGLGARQVAVAVRLPDGTAPAPDARVTWRGRPLAGAATVTADGAATAGMTGHARAAATADAAGATPPLVLPELIYDVVVEPAEGAVTAAPRLREVDLRPGSPAPGSLSLAPSARIDGVALTPADLPAAGVRVTATPRGALAAAAAGAAHAVTDGAGAFSLSVVGGADYELMFEAAPPGPAASPHARTFVAVTAPPAGDTLALDPLPLARAVTLTGRVTIPGVAGGARGVHLLVQCHDCAGADAGRSVAEAITDARGDYVLRVPDPAAP